MNRTQFAILTACFLSVSVGSTALAKQTRDSTSYHGSCGQQVMHKHPGLKKDAFKSEYDKCLNDNQAGKNYLND